MIIYIANAFSLSMLDREEQLGTPVGHVPASSERIGAIARVPRPMDDPMGWLDLWITALAHRSDLEIVSAVGHADTAVIFAHILGRPIAVNRVNVKLGKFDMLLVGQYIGPRLPEGATTLPEGARIEWWIV
jgi:hypothetical protein